MQAGPSRETKQCSNQIKTTHPCIARGPAPLSVDQTKGAWSGILMSCSLSLRGPRAPRSHGPFDPEPAKLETCHSNELSEARAVGKLITHTHTHTHACIHTRFIFTFIYPHVGPILKLFFFYVISHLNLSTFFVFICDFFHVLNVHFSTVGMVFFFTCDFFPPNVILFITFSTFVLRDLFKFFFHTWSRDVYVKCTFSAWHDEMHLHLFSTYDPYVFT